MPAELSARQRDTLRIIEEHLHKWGVPPSQLELAKALQVTGASALQHLRALERKGYIARFPGQARGIRLVRKGVAGVWDTTLATREIPVVGRVAAGTPILAFENLEGTIHLDIAQFHGDELFALRVQGDSMTGVGIVPGDLAIVRRQAWADPGDIVVTLLNNEATIKRLQVRQNQVLLVAENHNYEVIKVEGDDLQVQGKVIGIIRSTEGKRSQPSSATKGGKK